MTPSASPPILSYFKRYKMEVPLDPSAAPPEPPAGYVLLPWESHLLLDHAETLFAAFEGCVDTVVFPSLGDRSGCYFLMSEITRKPGFLPGATWLLLGPDGPCGTVQGLRDRGGVGAIQNLGIAPGRRNLGLGGVLLRHALDGFRRAGLRQGLLEVTAENEGAIRLYRRHGFRRTKTVYKAVARPYH